MIRTATYAALYAMLIGSAAPVFAEVAAEADIAEDQAAVVDLVVNFTAVNDVLREDWVDFDKDGVQEALVVLPAGDDGLHEWHVFGILKGQPANLLSWTSSSIELEELQPMRDADGNVMPETAKVLIRADGITFSKLKFGVEPYADIFFEKKVRPRPATAAELDQLVALGYTNARMELAPVLSMDFLSSPGRERIIALNDEFYRDEARTTPYLILAADDSILFEGRSTFHPWIYKDDINGVQLIEDNGDAFSLIQLEPGNEE